MGPELLVVAAVPAIALLAFIGGVTQDHPRRKAALTIGVVLSVLWVAFLPVQVTVSS